MRKFMLLTRSCGVALLGTAMAQVASAQSMGGVGYSPLAAQNVPTLSEWALMGMVMLLGMVAYLAMRIQRRGASKLLGLGAMALVALSSAAWNRPAAAVVVPDALMSIAAGGTADLPHRSALFSFPWTYVYQVQNQTGQAQRVTAVTSISGVSVESPAGSNPECTVGLVLQPNDVCYVKLHNVGLPG